MTRRSRRTNPRGLRSRKKMNNRTTYFVAGDHNVVDDQTGQVYKRSEMQYTWNNLLTHKKNWQPKEKQLTILTPKDRIAVRDVRTESITFNDNTSDGSDLPWPQG